MPSSALTATVKARHANHIRGPSGCPFFSAHPMEHDQDLADLAVVSQDILAVPPDKIRETKALLTLVGGRVVHRDG
jgi:hypothetical protein